MAKPLMSPDDLEAADDWDGALRARLREQEASPSDKNVLVKLAFLCWYVLAEWGCLSTKGLDEREYTRTLRSVSSVLLSRFADDADVSWLLGYTMSLFPWEFGSDVPDAERRARELLEEAHRLRPDDPVVALVLFANRHDTGDEYWRACEAARPQLARRFPGHGAMDTYFRQVLDRRRQ